MDKVLKNKALIIIISLSLISPILLSGCKNEKSGLKSSGGMSTITENIDFASDNNQCDTSVDTEIFNEDAIASSSTDDNEIISDGKESHKNEIMNSYSMMYYLAFIADKINASKNNRLILDDVYTELLNDINPSAIDETTQEHLEELRNIIKSYISTDIKRERLQFLYNQKKASALRSAVPNPLAVLSMAKSVDFIKLAIATSYTVVDSYISYKNASESADLDYITSGWDLDDEERLAFQKNRDRAFDYMVDMVQKYHLDGLKTLNENDVTTFTQICQIESPTEKVARLKTEKKKYELFGEYWLELANSYFDTGKYTNCLECIRKYKELSNDIYRKDVNYARILPKAIVAAQKCCSGNDYITVVMGYIDDLISNTDTNDWAARYFAAQVCLDLYSKTNDKDFLNNSYKLVHDNVIALLPEQQKINETYAEDVKEIVIEGPDYRYLSTEQKNKKEKEYKAEKNKVNEYNNQLKECRKTELPELYEPLVLNCELLFALAQKKDISQSEKKEIELLLKTDNRGTFIVEPINVAYSFHNKNSKYSVNISKDGIIIPASLLTKKSKIEIAVTEGKSKQIFDDFKITKVERNGNNVSDFSVIIESDKWDDYKWTADSKITITIKYCDAYNKICSLNYKVSMVEEHWYGNKVVFEQE